MSYKIGALISRLPDRNSKIQRLATSVTKSKFQASLTISNLQKISHLIKALTHQLKNINVSRHVLNIKDSLNSLQNQSF